MTLRGILRPRVNPLRLGSLLSYLPQFARLFCRLMNDERVSFFAKLVPVLGVLLVLNPMVLELDAIPIVGELDTVVVLYLAFKLFVWLCPAEVVREHVARIARGV